MAAELEDALEDAPAAMEDALEDALEDDRATDRALAAEAGLAEATRPALAADTATVAAAPAPADNAGARAAGPADTHRVPSAGQQRACGSRVCSLAYNCILTIPWSFLPDIHVENFSIIFSLSPFLFLS